MGLEETFENFIHDSPQDPSKDGTSLHISDGIEKLQVMQKEKIAKMMGDEFVECIRLAKEKNDMSFEIKGNGLKRKSENTKLLLNCKIRN